MNYNSDEQAEASAEYDKPCQAYDQDLQSASAPKLYKSEPSDPNVEVTKRGRNDTKGTAWTEDEVEADVGDVIEWEITYESNGSVLAKNVEIKEVLPASMSYVATSFSATNCAGCTERNYFVADAADPGCTLGDMAVGASCVVTFETEVDNCTADPTTNEAVAEYGCCDADPAEQTSTRGVDVRTTPDYAGGDVALSHGPWTTCGGQMTITLTNSGGTAVTKALSIPFPPATSLTRRRGSVTSSPPTLRPMSPMMIAPGDQPLNCTGVSGNTPTWDDTNIDKIYPGETITITYWARVESGSAYCDTTAANDTDDLDITIPDDLSRSVEYTYDDLCGNSGITVSANDTIDPAQPDIDITISPTEQVVAEGQQASWTITLENEGDADASNITFTDVLGDGFSNPSDNQGGSWTGNTGEWNPRTIPAGDTWTVTITADVGEGALTHGPQVDGACTDQGGFDTCTYTHDESDAYTAGFDLTKTVDKATANVGELLTYRVTAVFSNTDTFQNVTIVDTLPPYVEYVTANQLGTNTLAAGAVTVAGTLAGGQTLTWTPADFNGRAVFDYEITARIRNQEPENVAEEVLTNSVEVDFDVEYSDGHISTFDPPSESADTTITEPDLTVTKTITPDSGDAGDTVTITLVVENTGDGPAREVTVTDLVNDTNNDGAVDGSDFTVYQCPLAEATTPPGWSFSTDGADPACQVTWDSDSGAGDIPAGESRTFEFTAVISPSAITGSTYPNTAGSDSHSLDHDDPEFDNTDYDAKDRTQYADTGSDDLTISPPSAQDKTLMATSEDSTDSGDANINSDPPVAVGEIITAEIRFVFPEGITNNVQIFDRLRNVDPNVNWGGYVDGSATLRRTSTDLESWDNPGGINGRSRYRYFGRCGRYYDTNSDATYHFHPPGFGRGDQFGHERRHRGSLHLDAGCGRAQQFQHQCRRHAPGSRPDALRQCRRNRSVYRDGYKGCACRGTGSDRHQNRVSHHRAGR